MDASGKILKAQAVFQVLDVPPVATVPVEFVFPDHCAGTVRVLYQTYGQDDQSTRAVLWDDYFDDVYTSQF
jgi:hypothetical protein